MSREETITVRSGWAMLPLTLGLLVAAPLIGLTAGLVESTYELHAFAPLMGFLSVTTGVVALVGLGGHFTLQPNEARVLTLFGSYVGSVRESGFHWTNPFRRKQAISLRARNLNGTKLKVNDKRGSPIEIATVVVWRVEDTAKALFDVDKYEDFVSVQSESALRHLASSYAYEDAEHGEPTLRSSADEISLALQKELQVRLRQAGVVVEEARLSHLAYAPEIAQAMLRRQQAEAIIAARQKIVTGAVGMVESAISELGSRGIVHLTEEQKARLVGNLLVVLCAESEVQPIVPTGQ